MSASYDTVLSEMKEALEKFSENSDQLDAYEYEKQFRELTDKYNHMLLQASIGKVPKSKNEKSSIETSFGKIEVKKKGTP